MRNIVVLILVVMAAMLDVNLSFAQQSNDSILARLNVFLDKWHLDAANCNHEAYIGAMSPEGVFIGTDPAERWTAEAFGVWSKPYFDRKSAWTFKAIQRNINLGKDGITAWFDELLETRMGVCRGSGVLQKRNGSWKIEQYVLSATIPNEQMKTVTRNKAGYDSLFVKKINER